MGVREDIIDSMNYLAAEATESLIRFEKHGDTKKIDLCKSLSEMAFQMRTMAQNCVPIQVNLTDPEIDTIMRPSYEFGKELLDYGGDEERMRHSFGVTEIQLPYERILVYGPCLRSVGGDKVAYFVEGTTPTRISIVQLMGVASSLGAEWAPYLVMSQDLEKDTFFSVWPTPILTGGKDELDKERTEWAKTVHLNSIDFFIGFYGMLNMKQVETVDVPAPRKLNKARAKKGKEQISDIVQIRLTASTRASLGTGTHASPKPHWRRGHVRQLSSGKRVPVQPTMVMAKDGIIPLPKRVDVRS